MPSRRDWYVAALLIGLGGLFLIVAAAVRWLPCLGNDDSAACAARQSHAFDYLVPVEPVQALPTTAVLGGLGLLLVAAAWPFVIRRLAVRRPVLRTIAAMIMTAKPLVLGLLAPDAEVAPGSGLLTGVVLMVCGGGIAAITATTPERQLPSAAARDPLERPADR